MKISMYVNRRFFSLVLTVLLSAVWPGFTEAVIPADVIEPFEAVASERICNAAPCEQPIVFLTEHSLPGTFLDAAGKPSGPMVELVQELVNRMQQQGVYYLLPWARAMQRAQKTPRSVLFETVRTPEREKQFQWVGPVKYYDMQLYGPARFSGLSVAELSESAIACGYRGASYIPALQAMGFTEGANLVLVTRSGDCITMLQRGRADVTPLNENRHGVLYQEAALQLIPLHSISEVALYLAFSLDFSAAEIALWQQTLEQIYRDGTLRQRYQSVFPEKIISKLEQLAVKN